MNTLTKTEEMQKPNITKIKPTISDVSDNDVLCGRGRGLENHPGNIAFRRRIRKYVDRYDKASRQEKGVMLLCVSRQMRADSIRFYKRGSDGEWGELNENETKQKIGHALRDTRDRINSSGATDLLQILPPAAAGPNIDYLLQEIQKSKMEIQKSKIQLLTGAMTTGPPFINSTLEGSTEITAVQAFAAAFLQNTNQRNRSDALVVGQGGEPNDNAGGVHGGGENLPSLQKSFEEAMESHFLRGAGREGDAAPEDSDFFPSCPPRFPSCPPRLLCHESTRELGNVDVVGKIESIDNDEEINYIVEEVYNDFQNDSGDDTNEGVSDGSPPGS
jgi:hypothetical protein